MKDFLEKSTYIIEYTIYSRTNEQETWFKDAKNRSDRPSEEVQEKKTKISSENLNLFRKFKKNIIDHKHKKPIDNISNIVEEKQN